MTDDGHHRDICGVCIYCNACDAPSCCEQGECDRNVVRALGESRRRLEAELKR